MTLTLLPRRAALAALTLFPVSPAVYAASPAEAPVPGPGYAFQYPLVFPEGSVLDLSKLNKPISATDRIVIKDGHFFHSGQQKRIRLFGANLCCESFLTEANVGQQAQRLAQLGFNAVRLHGLDKAGAGLFADAQQTRLDETKLRKLDEWLKALRDQGIYVNLNLHVNRIFPGLPVAGLGEDDAFRYGKMLALFDPDMITLQKQYAADLLNRVNTATQVAYKDDPTIFVVELTNEDSLAHLGPDELLKAFDRLAAYDAVLSAKLKARLQQQWNTWLAAKYGTDAELIRQWTTVADSGAAVPMPLGTWIKQNDPAPMTLTESDQHRQLSANAPQAGSSYNSLQVVQPGLPLQDGRWHTIEFDAKANAARLLTVSSVQTGGKYLNCGTLPFVRVTDLGTGWQHYRFVFKVTLPASPATCSVVLNFNNTPGLYEISKFSVYAGGLPILPPATSLKQGNIPIGGTAGNPLALRDWGAFVLATETKYIADLRAHLQGLGVKALISGSQAVMGGAMGTLREGLAADFVDEHAYWDHPQHMWGNLSNWTIGNRPMVHSPTRYNTLTRLAFSRVAGKPFTVSEYDHSAPNFYAGEGLPMAASFGSYQDWDALYQFSYLGNGNPNAISNSFSIQGHIGKLIGAQFGALFFRHGVVPAGSPLTIPFGPHRVLDAYQANPDGIEAAQTDLLIKDRRQALVRRVAVDVLDRTTAPFTPSAPSSTTTFVTDNQAITWDIATAGRHRYLVNTPSARLLTGQIGGGTSSIGSDLSLTLAATGAGYPVANWAQFQVVSLDGGVLGTAARALVALHGAIDNADMAWADPARTRLTAWGSQIRLEAVSGTLKTRLGYNLYALDPNGRVACEVPQSSETDAGGNVWRVWQLKAEWRTPLFLFSRNTESIQRC